MRALLTIFCVLSILGVGGVGSGLVGLVATAGGGIVVRIVVADTVGVFLHIILVFHKGTSFCTCGT